MLALYLYFLLFILKLVVPLLTYLLTKEGLTPREIVGHMTEVVGAGVDTVSKAFSSILL